MPVSTFKLKSLRLMRVIVFLGQTIVLFVVCLDDNVRILVESCRECIDYALRDSGLVENISFFFQRKTSD